MTFVKTPTKIVAILLQCGSQDSLN